MRLPNPLQFFTDKLRNRESKDHKRAWAKLRRHFGDEEALVVVELVRSFRIVDPHFPISRATWKVCPRCGALASDIRTGWFPCVGSPIYTNSILRDEIEEALLEVELEQDRRDALEAIRKKKLYEQGVEVEQEDQLGSELGSEFIFFSTGVNRNGREQE